MKKERKVFFRQYFLFSGRDTALSLLILAATTGLCLLLRTFADGPHDISVIYILSVFLIARFTQGYFYGIAASLISVVLVNYIFTYPYYHLNFTITGYPMTVLCMLIVAVITSMLTTQIKEQGNIRLEAEREKMRSNLLRAVSHDLRTPLTSILGASSAILENHTMLSDANRLELISGIKQDSEWLIRMVENLLTVTRFDSQTGAKLTKTPFPAEEVAAESVQKFNTRFPEWHVSVMVPQELLMVPMDALLIEQVLINLLENAALHADGATKIWLNVTSQPGSIYFEVCDDGCGIDENRLPHLFEGSASSVQTDTDHKRNMGIGLSVCRTSIRAHDGEISASNRKQGGASFRFTLPVKEESL